MTPINGIKDGSHGAPGWSHGVRVRWRRYRKAIVAAAGAIATAVATALTDDTITSGEWALVVVAVLTALGVYQVRNEG